jgi:hypothetical protein
MVGLGFDRLRGSGSLASIREGTVDDSGGGSLIRSRESIHVGGLFSRRERVIHHDPGRGPLYWPFDSIEKDRRHIRPRLHFQCDKANEIGTQCAPLAINSSTISFEILILFWKCTISKSTANAPSSPGTSSTEIPSGGIVAPSSISSVPDSLEKSGDNRRR